MRGKKRLSSQKPTRPPQNDPVLICGTSAAAARTSVIGVAPPPLVLDPADMVQLAGEQVDNMLAS